MIKARSDRLRKLITAAVDQNWGHEIGGKHPVIICPTCGHREIYTATGRQHVHEIKKKISRLRRHGVIFEGRGDGKCQKGRSSQP